MKHELARELLLAGLLGWLMLLAGAAALNLVQEFCSGQWLLQSSVLWCLVWQQVWQRRAANRSSTATLPYPGLGWANRLTLLRGCLIAATGGFLFQPQYPALHGWAPALLYLPAAMLDRVDGYVARRYGQTTVLGGELDTVFDALGLVVAPLLAVAYGKIHWSYLLVSLAYYLFQIGLRWRRWHGRPVHPLEPNTLRRTLAGFQMGFIAVALSPLMQAPTTSLIGTAFMVPVLIRFSVDWLIVSGRIEPHTVVLMRRHERIATFSATILQPLLRLLPAAVLFAIYLKGDGDGSLWPSDPMAGYGLLLGAALMALGLAGRSGALVILILLAWRSADGDPARVDTTYCVTIFSAAWILLLGTGRASLWRPENRWLDRNGED